MSKYEEMRKEQFSAGEIAQALRIDGNLLQNWLRRSGLEQPPTIGGRRLFSFDFAVQLAMLKELNRHGMGPVQAGDLVRRAVTWFKLADLRGDEVILVRAEGGNSNEDVERGTYAYDVFRLGKPFNYGWPSGLFLAIGAIADQLENELKNVLWLRRGGVDAV